MEVLLCIETRIYRQGLSTLLESCEEVDQVTTCTDLHQLRHLTGASRSRVILVDCSLVLREGALAARVKAATGAACGSPVIAIGLDESEEEILAMVEAGAAAYVTKNDSIADLVAAMHAALIGELHCAPRIARQMQERLVELSKHHEQEHRLEGLSGRERHVLGLVERSMSNKQIARELGLEVSTIKNHVHNIIVKLSVKTRMEAAGIYRSIDNPEL